MDTATYTRRMAEKFLASMEHYGDTSPPVGDGRMGTPAYYASKLGNAAVNALGMTLPGEATDWWGFRYKCLAQNIVSGAMDYAM
jgi:hypothetical protein